MSANGLRYPPVLLAQDIADADAFANPSITSTGPGSQRLLKIPHVLKRDNNGLSVNLCEPKSTITLVFFV